MIKKTLTLLIFVTIIESLQAADNRSITPSDTTLTETSLLVEPTVSVKSNLLYDLTGTLNLGAEFRLGNRWSIDLPVNYNPWSLSKGKKIKHWLFQPELRYWTKQSFRGSFWGLHLHAGEYNVARIFSKNRQYEGWLAGAGISYGYRWNLSRHWAMEASIGVGYAYLDYDRYHLNDDNCCGQLTASTHKHYLGVTKAAVSLIYNIGKRPKARTQMPGQVTDIMPYLPPRTDTVRVMRTDTLYIAPAPEVHYRQEIGRAYVLFPVDRSVLNPDYAQNRIELQTIERSMQTIRRHADAEIKAIRIESFASPEGGTKRNDQLAEQRAAALRDYMMETYALPAQLFTTCAGSENWKGLREAIATTGLLTDSEKQDLDKLLDIEDTEQRKARIKAYKQGTVYERLLKNIYPSLRISTYQIDYTIPFTKTK
jgi:outer membrane protein OmpA-like peptidoglycan-associated protein